MKSSSEEIADRLHRLRYEGKWSFRALSLHTGICQSAIKSALVKKASRKTLTRLKMIMPMISDAAPPKPLPKRKPGERKRYYIRYFNLVRWLSIIEQEPGLSQKFKVPNARGVSKTRVAYICTQLDYYMKRHLLDLFGGMLESKKVVMADCYPAEKWIERIHAILPGVKVLLFKKLLAREIP